MLSCIYFFITYRPIFKIITRDFYLYYTRRDKSSPIIVNNRNNKTKKQNEILLKTV